MHFMHSFTFWPRSTPDHLMALQQMQQDDYESLNRTPEMCSSLLTSSGTRSWISGRHSIRDSFHNGCLLGRPGSLGYWRGVALILPTTTAVRGAPAEKESTVAIVLMRPPSWPMAFLAASTSSCNGHELFHNSMSCIGKVPPDPTSAGSAPSVRQIHAMQT